MNVFSNPRCIFIILLFNVNFLQCTFFSISISISKKLKWFLFYKQMIRFKAKQSKQSKAIKAIKAKQSKQSNPSKANQRKN